MLIRLSLCLTLLLIGVWPAYADANANSDENAQSCVQCHAEVVSQWHSSHHANAMATAEAGAFLGRFDGSGAEHQGHQFRFYQEDDQYWVRITDPQGEQNSVRLQYSLGVYPLQQYLAALDGGRWQTIPVAWDARAKKDGGQRWYALDSDLPWQHPAFTANGNCIDCHSTGFSKNFDADSGTFTTQWQHEGISCAACHGDSSAHLRWAASVDKATDSPLKGYTRSLKHRSEWQFIDGNNIAMRTDKHPNQDLQSCGRCHALRDRIEPASVESPLADQISLQPLTAPHYFADGQIHGEVFVMGSFLQSKMHAAGVSCSDCHNPHSNELKAEGDALCLRCHQAEHFAARQHHKHPPQAVACVDCHMPASTYMGVDDRRDHRFGIPDPLLSEQLGSPSPCRDCHSDRTAKELAASVKPARQARRVSAAVNGDSRAQQQLLSQIADDSLPPIWQSSMLSALLPASEASIGVAVAKLQHANPMLREAAIRHLHRFASPAQRAHFITPLLTDRMASVRLASAEALADIPPEEPSQRAAWQDAQQQLDAQLRADLDVPQGAMRYGEILLRRGQPQAAAEQYQAAIELDAEFIPALLALARLYEQHAEQGGGEKSPLFWLDQAVQRAPQQGMGYYARGLYRVRQGQYNVALRDLAQAAKLNPDNEDWQYTYAVALENMGRGRDAIAHLRQLLEAGPKRPRLAQLLQLYQRKYGQQQ